MRRSVLAVLAIAIVFLVGAIVSGVAGRTNSVNAERMALSQRSAVEAQLLGNYFTRASSLIELNARSPLFVDFYRHQAVRGGQVELAEEAVERINDELAILGRMYAGQIGEASFVDISGMENARVVAGRALQSDELARDKRTAPFFAPTFALSPGAVYQSKPYISESIGEWVISSGTQIPTTYWGGRRALVHFELPVESFRREVDTGGHGHLVVVDADTGRVVFDTARSQRGRRTLGDPDTQQFVPLVRQWGEAGSLSIDGRAVAYQRVPPVLGSANHWYAVTIAPTAEDTFTGVGWLPIGVFLIALLMIAYAVSILVRGESALRSAANTDPLTGLGNRRRLAKDLQVQLGRASRLRPSVLILSDLNGFKPYNDTFGHPAGDALLVRLARALSDAVAGCGVAYRIGGDEFCVLAQPGPDGIDHLITGVRRALRDEDHAVIVTASHGVVMLPAEAAEPTAAMDLVDRRMYEQKRASLRAGGDRSSHRDPGGPGQPIGASRVLAPRDLPRDLTSQE